MANYIVIKGADFSANKVKTVTLQDLPVYEDITNKLIQGYISDGAKVYSAEHIINAVVPKYCVALEDTNHYLADCQDVEFYLPSTVQARLWVAKGTNVITDNVLGTGDFKRGSDITGSDSWITAPDIYSSASETSETYPLCGMSLRLEQTPDVTPAQMVTLGVRIRRKIRS